MSEFGDNNGGGDRKLIRELSQFILWSDLTQVKKGADWYNIDYWAIFIKYGEFVMLIGASIFFPLF